MCKMVDLTGDHLLEIAEYAKIENPDTSMLMFIFSAFPKEDQEDIHKLVACGRSREEVFAERFPMFGGVVPADAHFDKIFWQIRLCYNGELMLMGLGIGDCSLEELNLSTSANNALKHAGIATLGMLFAWQEEGFEMRNLGTKCKIEVAAKLKETRENASSKPQLKEESAIKEQLHALVDSCPPTQEAMLLSLVEKTFRMQVWK